MLKMYPAVLEVWFVTVAGTRHGTWGMVLRLLEDAGIPFGLAVVGLEVSADVTTDQGVRVVSCFDAAVFVRRRLVE